MAGTWYVTRREAEELCGLTPEQLLERSAQEGRQGHAFLANSLRRAARGELAMACYSVPEGCWNLYENRDSQGLRAEQKKAALAKDWMLADNLGALIHRLNFER